MSKLFYKAMIEDIQNEKCTDAEIVSLLDIFEYTMKKTATTLARKAWFELKDFQTARKFKLEDFTLFIEKRVMGDQEQWWGTFESPCKNLKVMGTLERD